MASGVRLLLRLPPAIRQQVLNTGNQWTNTSICRVGQQLRSDFVGSHQIRTFSLSSYLAKNKQNVFKNAQPQKPTPQARNLPKPVPPPRKFAPNAMPAPIGPDTSRTAAPRAHYTDYLSTRFPNSERVLLYVAPDHGGFFAISFFGGFVFLLGAYTYAQTFLKDEEGRPAKPWWLKALGAVPTLTLAILGTTFVLAPMKVIKSVTLIPATGFSTVGQNPKLRMEIKRVMPWSKPDILEVEPRNFVLDRNVPQTVNDLRFFNYEMKDASGFTEYYFSGELGKKHDSAFRRFNRGLLHLWPSLVKNSKRMFLRDQIAYVRIPGNGNFKLDLQGAHILDYGRVLERIATEDVNFDRSLVGFLKKITS